MTKKKEVATCSNKSKYTA